MQRWNFPFKSIEIARLYLRTADDVNKKSCGIYEIKNIKGRVSYKIFAAITDLEIYLQKNKDKTCSNMLPVFKAKEYLEFPKTQIRKLTNVEIESYMYEKSKCTEK